MELSVFENRERQRDRIKIRHDRDDARAVVHPLAVGAMPSCFPCQVKRHPVCPERIADEAKTEYARNPICCSDADCGPDCEVPD
jgi:hypothetical protein